METIDQQLEIVEDASLSIADLVRLKNEGFSVIRSAHVGNLSPYNLTLAQAGIPILSVDHTITGVDKNYFPERIDTQSTNAVIAPAGRLSCRAISDDGSFVDERHITAVRQTIPKADIFTNTEYLRRRESISQELVKVGLRTMPGLFNRLVLNNGSVVKRPDASALVASCGILQLIDDPRAEQTSVLLPNSLDIIANFVIEALETETDRQYHLSGPDMVRYIGGLLPELNQLYTDVRCKTSFGAKLPTKLNVSLVPSAQAKFATTAERGDKLDDLLGVVDDADTEALASNERRKAFFASGETIDSATKSQFIASESQIQAAHEQQIAEALGEIPELLVEPGRRGFITQYDVAQEGGLYVAPINLYASMQQLSALSARLKKVQKRLLL